MASSICAIGSVRYIEVVRSSEGPLSEVPLYTDAQVTAALLALGRGYELKFPPIVRPLFVQHKGAPQIPTYSAPGHRCIRERS